jgi:hypothetical protein
VIQGNIPGFCAGFHRRLQLALRNAAFLFHAWNSSRLAAALVEFINTHRGMRIVRTLIAVLALLLITAPVYGQRHLVGGSGSSHKGGHYESSSAAGGVDDASSGVFVIILVVVVMLVIAVLASSGAFKPRVKLVVWRDGLPHCPKCGRQVSLKAARPNCRSCGHDLEEDDDPASSARSFAPAHSGSATQ